MCDLNTSHTQVTMTTMGTILAEALGHMQRPYACPEDVKARIASLRVPVDDSARSGRGNITTNWRSAPVHQPSSSYASAGNDKYPRHAAFGVHQRSATSTGTPASAPPPPSGSARFTAPRLGNRSRTDATVEDRMLDRIRDKMNKFSDKTYAATKSWLCQLLDSGETDFLNGFITLVFEKAAMENLICPLYAKLVAELRTEFPHFNTEVRRILQEFIAIFEEARGEPETNTVEYEAFLVISARRKYRRGYSVFLGEVAKHGVLEGEEIFATCKTILTQLTECKGKTDQQLLCEEFADCASALVKSCVTLLQPNHEEIKTLTRVAMDRTDAPSLTNKARFGLMDIMDIL